MLQARLAQQTSVVSQPSSGSGACPQLVRPLAVGMSGSDVLSLQQFLAQDRSVYPDPQITGYFGLLTEQAVQRWQMKYRVVSGGDAASTGFGRVGPATRNAMLRVCTPGSTNTNPFPPVVSGRACGVGSTILQHNETRTFFRNAQSTICEPLVRTCNDGSLSGDASYIHPSCTPQSLQQFCVAGGISVENGGSRTFYSKQRVPTNESCSTYTQVRTCVNGVFTGSPEFSFSSCNTYTPQACMLSGVQVAHGSSRTFYSRSSATSTESCSNFSLSRTCDNGTFSGDGSYVHTACTQGACALDGVVLANGESQTFYFARQISAAESCTSYGQTRLCTNGTLSGNSSYAFSSCSALGSGACILDGKQVPHGSSSPFYSRVQPPAGGTCTTYRQSRSCTNGVLSGSASYNWSTCNADVSCTIGTYVLPHASSSAFFSTSSIAYGGSCASYRQSRSCTNGVPSGSTSYTHASCTVRPPQ